MPHFFMKCLLCKKNTDVVIAKRLRGGEKKSVFYCKDCCLGFLENTSSEKKLADFYQQDYRKITSHKLNKGASPKELFDGAVMFQDSRINILKKHFGKNKRLLEIGCSAGMFLWHARNYVKEIVGIDYDSRSAKFASQKCNCKTYDMDIDKTGLKGKSFDIICAFQTLEHVENPIEFISKHKKYLKPGGIMAIEVPNLRDALLYAYGIPAYERFYYHNAHLWYFTGKSLKNLMVRGGLRGAAHFTQDYNLINHLNWILNNQPQPSSLVGLSDPVLPVRKSLEPKVKNSLAKFIKKADRDYKKTLSDLGVSANIFFLGKNHG